MTHTIKDGVLTTQNMANGGVVGTTVTAVDKQQLAYSNISIQFGPVPCNSEIEISATIKNTGKGMAAAVIPVDDNGTIKYIYGDLESDSGLSTSGEPVRVSSNGVKTLEPGESIELSGTVTLPRSASIQSRSRTYPRTSKSSSVRQPSPTPTSASSWVTVRSATLTAIS